MPHKTPRPGESSPDPESTARTHPFPSRRSLRAPAHDVEVDLAPSEVTLRRAGRRVRTVDTVLGEVPDATPRSSANEPAPVGGSDAEGSAQTPAARSGSVTPEVASPVVAPAAPTAAPVSSRRARRAAQQSPGQPERDEVAASTIAVARPHTPPSTERKAPAESPRPEVSGAGRPASAPTASASSAGSSAQRRGGRRASGTSSDDIERPAGGRRAVVSTPTTAIPIITPEQISAAKAPARVTVTPLDDVEVVSVPAAGAPAAPQTPLVPDVPSGTAGDGTAPALPAIPPVRRARRARTDAEGNVIVDPPVPVEADPVVAEKRSKSSRRRRASAPAGPPPGADQNPSDQPPLSRRARRSTIVRVGVSTLGMLFAAGLAVGTSLPASVFSASALDSGMTIGDVAPGLEGQALTTAADAGAASVARDGYSVTDIKQVAAASGIRMANTFVNDPTSPVQWPFPVGVPISDGFGPRESPGGIGSTDHKGVDFTPGQGTAIGSIADGVVSTVVPYDGGGLGVYVMIDHVIDGQEVTSVYGHMLTGSIEVEVGQAVKVGQPIGRVGNTGTSTGAHLHLEIRLNGTTPVDPYAFLQAHVGA